MCDRVGHEIGDIDFGDGCWRQNLLMTTLGYCHIDEADNVTSF